jgi:hypothetical protein
VTRRAFITLLGGAAAAWPLAARAQLQPKILRVGFVGMLPRESPLYANFLKRMAELGYQEGRNFNFDLLDRRPTILAEVGNRLVIGNEPARQPHHLNVAPSFTLKPSTRLNAIEVAVNVESRRNHTARIK